MKGWSKLVFVNALVTLLLIFLSESISAIAWYQKNKEDGASVSSTVRAVNHLLYKFSLAQRPQNQCGEWCSLEEILRLRKNGVEAYPSYLFDPQHHIDLSRYHLAHPIDSTVVYCDENGFYTTFRTDEIGFRNPKNQLGKNIDLVLLGDSFTEGACVNDQDTFAGVFRENGVSVLNLGRGGSGPLFQLATLKEYGSSVKPKVICWFIYTGNDLVNLREEKTTKLSLYLENKNYSQSLLQNKYEVSEQLKTFLNREIELGQERRKRGLPPSFFHAYGETLDKISAEQKEVVLLRKVAVEILEESKRLGARLFIVLINHPRQFYNFPIQEITTESIRDFANATETSFFSLSRQELARQEQSLYPKGEMHFSPNGYRLIGGIVLEQLNRNHLTRR